VPVEVWVVDYRDGTSIEGALVEPQREFTEERVPLITAEQGKVTFYTPAGYEILIAKFSQRRTLNWGGDQVTVSRHGYSPAVASVPAGRAVSYFGPPRPKEKMVVVLKETVELTSAGGN
jgi:hypothetical protein